MTYKVQYGENGICKIVYKLYGLIEQKIIIIKNIK